MLRRYTSLGLQNHQLHGPTILLGSSPLCDIVVKGANVAERHALIEYHPITRSYWIRDLGTLGGTYLNDSILYGMTELKSADVLRFGKSAEYIFDMPPIQPSPDRPRRASSFRHSQCAESLSDGIALPVVGSKIIPKNGNERFIRSPLPPKKLCQQPPQTKSSDSEGTPKKLILKSPPLRDPNIRPISGKPRSLSLGRSHSTTDARKLPYLKMPSNSSGYSSTEPSLLTQLNGTGMRKGKNSSVGNQLLQRVVRLQHELKRKDEEIGKLKENASLPSTTGDRVKGHLDEYRIALAEQKAENEKLRAVIAQDSSMPPVDTVVKELNDKLAKAEHTRNFQHLVYQTFFTVAVNELEDINKTLVKSQS